MDDTGTRMHALCRRLFPICRSITGNGLRESLAILKTHLPGMTIHEVPSGTACFDWTVPMEWNVRDAFIIDPDGSKICDFHQSNLHVVGHSTPVDKTVPLETLQAHLHSLPDQPDAIPYVTSYYNPAWGFCITHNNRKKLRDGDYRVYIDSDLKNGFLTYGELIIPGRSLREVFLSTYLCHPSMANNELSGPVVTTFLANWLSGRDNNFTYRIIFIPETIGAIAYLSANLPEMKKNIVAGFNITCIGDDRGYSFLPSRKGGTLADRAALHVLRNTQPAYTHYSFLDRGSDERQYCSPGVDLPICSIMRTKYGCYPEYHTSLDNLDLVTPTGLYGGYQVLRKTLKIIESNMVPQATTLCEPQLGARGLYPLLSQKNSGNGVREMLNLLAYSDGNADLIEIAEILGKPAWELLDAVTLLKNHGLIENTQRGA